MVFAGVMSALNKVEIETEKIPLIIFTPYNQDNVGILNPQTDTFSTVSTTGENVSNNSKYNQCTAIGSKAYFSPWNENNIKGPQGWINDTWNIVVGGAPTVAGDIEAERDIERKLHQTIDIVNRGLEEFSFNTSIAEQMKFKNFFKAALAEDKIGADMWTKVTNAMVRLIAPFAPHMAEELWARLGQEYSVHTQNWPEYDPDKAKESTVELVIMIDGKPRDTISVPAEIEKEKAQELALVSDVVKRTLGNKAPKRVIFIPGRKGSDPKVNIVI